MIMNDNLPIICFPFNDFNCTFLTRMCNFGKIKSFKCDRKINTGQTKALETFLCVHHEIYEFKKKIRLKCPLNPQWYFQSRPYFYFITSAQNHVAYFQDKIFY